MTFIILIRAMFVVPSVPVSAPLVDRLVAILLCARTWLAPLLTFLKLEHVVEHRFPPKRRVTFRVVTVGRSLVPGAFVVLRPGYALMKLGPFD